MLRRPDPDEDQGEGYEGRDVEAAVQRAPHEEERGDDLGHHGKNGNKRDEDGEAP